MTKIVTVTLGTADGSPEAEGWVIINYAALEGGRTNIGAQVKRSGDTMPTWAAVAALLLSNMGRNEWPRDIVGKLSDANPNVMRLSVPDTMDTVQFYAEWNPTLDQSAPHQVNPDFIQIAEETF